MKYFPVFSRSVFITVLTLTATIHSHLAFAQNRPMIIDVSSYQGSGDSPPTTINWVSVKGAKINYAWAKAAEGNPAHGYHTDPDFAYNETHAKAAGVLIGAYYFAHPDSDLGIAGADAEATIFWNVAKPYLTGGGAYLMPMLDYETIPGSSYTKASSSAWVNEWCQDIVNLGKSNGVTLRPIIYTEISFTTSYLDSSVTNWPLWIASPNGQNSQTGQPNAFSLWKNWSFWQFGGGTVAGIEGSVDEDVFNGNTNTLGSFVIGGPGFTNQPVSVTVVAGTNVILSAGANGNPPLIYQWRFNGTNISGGTGNQFSITNVQLSDAGGYSVQVTNVNGSSISDTAFLSVEGPVTNSPASVLAPTGLVNWWAAEGNTRDLVGSTTGVPQGGVNYVNGEVGQAFHFDGSTGIITTGLGDVAVPWTACLWVYHQYTPQTSAGIFEDGTYSLKLEQYNTTREVGLSVLGVGDYVFSPAYIVPTNTWTHLAFVGTTTGTSLYVNGVLKASLANSIPLPRYYIGAAYITSSIKYVDFLQGNLDEIMVFNHALTAAQISGIYAAGNSGLIRAPEFTGMQTLDNGEFQLGFTGLTGKTFTIHSSSDLLTWTKLATVPNTTGTNQFTDVNSTNSEATFYRVSQP